MFVLTVSNFHLHDLVGCFEGQSYMLPKYPTNKIILIELARQLMVVHAIHLANHK